MKACLKKIEEGKRAGKKMLAVLLDPDKCTAENYPEAIISIEKSKADFIFIGGSLITKGDLNKTVQLIKQSTSIPVVIFPGDASQISDQADGILLLSVISGRNPDLLIGQHVQASIKLRQSGLEILPTGYILVESERMTTAVYMSQSLPVPSHKPEIAACTALAGEQLGLRLIYLDGGSGAAAPVSREMISQVSSLVTIPIIAGGGITSLEEANLLWDAGSTIVVIGTAAEKNPVMLEEFGKR